MIEAGATAKQRRAEHRRRVERPPVDGVDDQEPHGDRRSADQSGGDPFAVDPRHVALARGGAVRGNRGSAVHDALLSGPVVRGMEPGLWTRIGQEGRWAKQSVRWRATRPIVLKTRAGPGAGARVE